MFERAAAGRPQYPVGVSRLPAFRLNGQDLGEQRHICGLFKGPEDAETTLQAFAVEGLRQGDRVISVVEFPDRYLDRLGREAHVSAAVTSGQLEVLAWSESYLVGGRFDSSRVFAKIRRLIRGSDSFSSRTRSRASPKS